MFFIFYFDVFEKEGEEEIKIRIEKNLSAKKIAKYLKQKGVIKRELLFLVFAKITGKEDEIKAGVYRLKKNTAEFRVLSWVSKGRFEGIRVTIPEGLTRAEIAHILFQKNITDSIEFIRKTEDRKLLRKYRIPFSSFEGFLFPDTYIFFEDTPAERVISKMVERFFEVYEEIGGKMENLDTVVILASIVEKEAFFESEKPIIASVYWNRLKKHMRLEADVTVQYALGKHKKRLTYADLRINSPYNTYLHPGLPPGPICSPGEKSLESVINPARTDYLYFVAKGDGSHIFSKTLAEHERNRKKLRKKRRRYGI